jgi:hypothetical protein
MSVARLGHAMVELPQGPNALGLSTGPGKVMVIGGFDSEPDAPHTPANPLASCEIYDPTTNTWTAAAPHPTPLMAPNPTPFFVQFEWQIKDVV